jgi:ABC-type branched-subunit amino acid transport system substrate-binding protein
MKRTHLAAALAVVLTLAACSTKAGDSGSSGSDSSGVKTGKGVTATDVMTDKSGVFKNLGLGVTQGNELWAKDFNAAGGACGRQVKLEEVDHGYKADTAKTLYPQIEPKVLGFVQPLGSPVVAALKQNLASDKAVAAPASWSSELLDNPYVMIVGTTTTSR